MKHLCLDGRIKLTLLLLVLGTTNLGNVGGFEIADVTDCEDCEQIPAINFTRHRVRPAVGVSDTFRAFTNDGSSADWSLDQNRITRIQDSGDSQFTVRAYISSSRAHRDQVDITTTLEDVRIGPHFSRSGEQYFTVLAVLGADKSAQRKFSVMPQFPDIVELSDRGVLTNFQELRQNLAIQNAANCTWTVLQSFAEVQGGSMDLLLSDVVEDSSNYSFSMQLLGNAPCGQEVCSGLGLVELVAKCQDGIVVQEVLWYKIVAVGV